MTLDAVRGRIARISARLAPRPTGPRVMRRVVEARLDANHAWWWLVLECRHQVGERVRRPAGHGPYVISVPSRRRTCRTCNARGAP